MRAVVLGLLLVLLAACGGGGEEEIATAAVGVQAAAPESKVGTVITLGQGEIVDRDGGRWTVAAKSSTSPTDAGLFRNGVFISGNFVARATYEGANTLLEETTAFGTWRKTWNAATSTMDATLVSSLAPPAPLLPPSGTPVAGAGFVPSGYAVVWTEEMNGPLTRFQKLTDALYNPADDGRMDPSVVGFNAGVMTIGARLGAGPFGPNMETGGLTSKGVWTPTINEMLGSNGGFFFNIRMKTLGIDGAGGHNGGHTGFWMYSNDNAGGREIDFVEVLTRNVYGSQSGMFRRPMGTYHAENGAGGPVYTGSIDTGVDLAAGFHDYSFVLEPNRMVWLFDGRPYHERTGPGIGTAHGFGTQAFCIMIQTFIGEPRLSQDTWLGLPIDINRMATATATVDHITFGQKQ